MAGKKPWETRRVRLQEVLRDLRQDASLTQVELAKKLRSDQSFVSRYERGERRLDLVELEDIAAACGTTLANVVRKYMG